MSGASTQQNMIIGGAILAVFALGASFILAFTYDNTKATIAENEKLFLLNTLYQLVPASAIDNDLYTDKIKLSDNTLSYHQQAFTIYRARKNSQAVAAIFHVTTGQGYNGAIQLLVAINIDGTLGGVRVVKHRETPGLGDGIEIQRSHWITQFNGQSLFSPTEKQWRVKKDGGVFDQLTGATITPRAIVEKIKHTLVYFQQHQTQVFSLPSQTLKD